MERGWLVARPGASAHASGAAPGSERLGITGVQGIRAPGSAGLVPVLPDTHMEQSRWQGHGTGERAMPLAGSGGPCTLRSGSRMGPRREASLLTGRP